MLNSAADIATQQNLPLLLLFEIQSTDTVRNRRARIRDQRQGRLRMDSSNSEIYFSQQVSMNGLGDQLYQFHKIYGLGRHLGWTFLSSPFPPSRWCPELDACDFMGLRINEIPMESVINDCSVVEMTYDQLVEPSFDSASLPTGRPVLVMIKSTRALYSGNLPHEEQQFAFPFRERFSLRHGSSYKRSDHLRMSVHLRLGDVSWVQFCGGFVFGHLNTFTRDPHYVNVLRSPSLSSVRHLCNDLIRIVHSMGLTHRFACFSDGIPERLFKANSSTALGWLACKFPGLVRLFRNRKVMLCDRVVELYTELQGELEDFGKMPRTTLHIGNSAELTERTIKSFSAADVCIVSRDIQCFPVLNLINEQEQLLLSMKDPHEVNVSKFEEYCRDR